MENHQYTFEGTVEQLGELAQGMQRHRRGRLYARLFLVFLALPLAIVLTLVVLG